MWINKHVWAQLDTIVKSYEREHARLNALLAARDVTILDQSRALATHERQIGMLRERWASSEFKFQLIVKNLNQVQTERDQFLTRIVPGLKISTPHLGYEPVLMPPGVTFEDMGDAAAAVHGIDGPAGDPEPLDPDQIEGLVGEVVDASTVKKE